MPFVNSVRGSLGPQGRRKPYTTDLEQAIHYAGKSGNELSTGGTITTVGGYRIHTFNSGDTFNLNYSGKVEYLVVAGGGSGGSGTGGGGGAGGYRSGIMSISNGAYPVSIGNGGNASYGTNSTNGGSSSALGITSAGGGRGGGTEYSPAVNWNGSSGGSGGGGTTYYGTRPAGSGNVPSVSPSQGNPGYTFDQAGGGGGGAGAAATSVSGGAGISSSISGSSVTRARGGHGNSDKTAGPANSGQGGGGDYPHGGNIGGNGGSGVVIIRYQLDS